VKNLGRIFLVAFAIGLVYFGGVGPALSLDNDNIRSAPDRPVIKMQPRVSPNQCRSYLRQIANAVYRYNKLTQSRMEPLNFGKLQDVGKPCCNPRGYSVRYFLAKLRRGFKVPPKKMTVSCAQHRISFTREGWGTQDISPTKCKSYLQQLANAIYDYNKSNRTLMRTPEFGKLKGVAKPFCGPSNYSIGYVSNGREGAPLRDGPGGQTLTTNCSLHKIAFSLQGWGYGGDGGLEACLAFMVKAARDVVYRNLKYQDKVKNLGFYRPGNPEIVIPCGIDSYKVAYEYLKDRPFTKVICMKHNRDEGVFDDEIASGPATGTWVPTEAQRMEDRRRYDGLNKLLEAEKSGASVNITPEYLLNVAREYLDWMTKTFGQNTKDKTIVNHIEFTMVTIMYAKAKIGNRKDLPDLVITDIIWDGKYLVVEYMNQGKGVGDGGFTFNIQNGNYLSEGNDDNHLFKVPAPGQKANTGQKFAPGQIKLEDGMDAYIEATIDPKNGVKESNEGNNHFGKKILIGDELPDLVIKDIFYDGKYIGIEYANIGNGFQKGAFQTVFRSGNYKFLEKGQYLMEAPRPGTSAKALGCTPMHLGLKEGMSQVIEAEINCNGDVRESNIRNNRFEKPVRIFSRDETRNFPSDEPGTATEPQKTPNDGGKVNDVDSALGN